MVLVVGLKEGNSMKYEQKFFPGDLVWVQPGSIAGGSGSVNMTEIKMSTLGIVTQVTRPPLRSNKSSSDFWLHLQNGAKDIYFYDYELEKATT